MKENIKVTITEKATELPAEAILIKGLMEGLLIATNYKETVTACDALLAVALEYPVTIVRAADRIRVLINTPNRKTLAEGIVDAICHYFGDTSHNTANTADPDIIIKRATAWAQAQPNADLLNPLDYAGCVVLAINKLLASSNPTLSLKPRRFDEAEHNAIVDKVQEWYNKKMAQPQPLNDEQPAESVPGVSDKRKCKISPVVNADGLKKHFNMRFQNNGYFNSFVTDIADLRTVKDCATVANMVYTMPSGKGFIDSFSTFAAWCRAFFDYINIVVPDGYNWSKKPKPTNELKRKFYYLV